MKRRHDEVNTRRVGLRPLWVAIVAASLVASASSCGGRERRAEKLWRQALERVEKGDTQSGVDLLQKLIDEYPDAEVASKARDQIVVYRGLASAVQSYPARRARELMVQVARAIESFRAQTGHAPQAVADLVPAKLPAVPQDPWGRAFLYEAAGTGYRLRSLGSDGAAGGTGDAADLLVVNGDFVTERP